MDFAHPEWKQQFFPNSEIITTPLKKYQRKDVAWMMYREKNPYKRCRGGVLGNEPGLGKTLTCLSLIACHRVQTTLVIVPASLIDNWILEIKRHTTISVEDNVFVYYGTNRTKALQEMAENPNIRIVITTYGTLVSETGKGRENGDIILLNYTFERVILDEGHCAKNLKGKTFQIMKSVIARYRWVITATPIQNYPKEVFSYLEILQTDMKRAQFDLKTKQGLLKLQEQIYALCMIRLKKDFLDLPDKNYDSIFIDPSKEECEFYEALKEYSTIRIQKLLRRYKSLGTGSEVSRKLRLKAYNSIFVLILRLRQACDSPHLVVETMERTRGKSLLDGIKILRHYSQNVDFKEECGLCMNATANVISECGHKACEQCWQSWNGPCPFCRRHVPKGSLAYCIPPVEEQQVDSNNTDFLSSKAELLFGQHLPFILGRGEKVIIASQFLKYLAYLMRRFKKEYPNLDYLSIDGSVNPRSRNQLLEKFRNDPNCPVCFISFTSSPEGLNIVQARWVLLLEKYWNSKKELQLIDRTHRIGQEFQVNIVHYFIRNSIEEKILELVNHKDEQIDMFLQNKDPPDGDNWIQRTIKLLS